LFFPPLVAKWRPKNSETEYAVGAIPLGGYVKITGMNPAEEIPPEVAHRAYYRQPVWKRVVVISAGPLVNIVLAFVLLVVIFLGWGVYDGTSDRIAAVDKNKGAAQVLRPGDRVVAVDGKRGGIVTLRDQIATHRCAGAQVDGCKAAEPAQVTVIRAGRERTFSITPVYEADVKRPLVGFSWEQKSRAVGAVEAGRLSADAMWLFTKGTVETIAGIFQAEKREQISGVVGSYETTRQAINFSAERALFLLAVISLSLGIINLFPFLPLDGGHIFWALAEKVRGRAIPFSVMERAGFIGFALVIALFLIGFTNDIGRLTGDGFQIR
jgi:regulator of sigma E protease